MPCWEMTISGRVQGVGYRWFVQHVAEKYNIKGYVKNLADGDVCIVATGNDDVLALFADEIKQGNRHAQVRQMTVNEITHYTEYEDFIIV
jgi:acylphosphatase